MFRGELWVGLHSGVLLKVTDRKRSRTDTDSNCQKSKGGEKFESLMIFGGFSESQ